ncbi:head maturation protease, ClpP-related [Prosthecochloris sp.]|uniref:head maturation protease, ClpP-related n=1 Tax=Prosthecochloris sp. TaxID=290513 RepID=UPI0025ECC0F8|nr:head maturation protease, ClpP-related [Prosthecochloris sp.]
MDIKIHGEIGGWWDGISAKEVMAKLAGCPEGEEINVSVHSTGGDMMDGLAIYNALKMHDSKVVVTIAGLAASSASIIAMAGDEIKIPENAFLMIHNPWGFVSGESKDFEDAASLFRQFEATCAKVYAGRSGKDVEEIQTMLDESTWLDGAQAVEMGFADTVVDAVKIAALARMPKCLADDCPVKFELPQANVSGTVPTKNPVPDHDSGDEPGKGQETQDKTLAILESANADAVEIVELCQIAGQSDRAAGWLKDRKKPDEVRAMLAKLAITPTPQAGVTTAPDINEELQEAAKTNFTVRSLLAADRVNDAIKHIKKKEK